MGTTEMQWKPVYRCGAICAIIFLAGIILDMVAGNVTGGDVSALPQTAIDRFEEFQESPLLGLYHLDLLNLILQIILIPVFFALFAAHRKVQLPGAALAFILFLAGNVVFICNNTALPMLDLSRKFAVAESDHAQMMLASAGEALIARGAHGSVGTFIGFFLPTIGTLLMAFIMLRGKVFTRVTAWLGIAGNILMLFYLILVTFVPACKNIAMIIAMPPGLLILAWMILYTIGLIRLAKNEEK